MNSIYVIVNQKGDVYLETQCVIEADFALIDITYADPKNDWRIVAVPGD